MIGRFSCRITGKRFAGWRSGSRGVCGLFADVPLSLSLSFFAANAAPGAASHRD
jgi:hypothetical protein